MHAIMITHCGYFGVRRGGKEGSGRKVDISIYLHRCNRSVFFFLSFSTLARELVIQVGGREMKDT